MQKEFRITSNGESFIIKNLSNRKREIFVHIKSVSGQIVFFSEFTIEPEQEITSFYLRTNFSNVDSLHNMSLTIYENNKLIQEEEIYKTYDRVYVIFANKNYEELGNALVKSLAKYSKYKVLFYGIDFLPTVVSENVINIHYLFDREHTDQQYMQFMKPAIFLDVLREGYKHVVYLDVDVQIRPNIDILFDIEQTSKGPIMQKQFWDYILMGDGLYIPAKGVRGYFGFEEGEQYYPHGITNVVIFNQTHKELFEKWKNICFSDEIQEIRKNEFLHDELLLNCLLWKEKMESRLEYMSVNIASPKDVKFFYQTNNLPSKPFVNLNDYSLGYPSQSFIPYNKDKIVMFHCLKDMGQVDEINKMIEQEEILKNNSEQFFKKKLIDFYTNIPQNTQRIMKTKVKYDYSYINGPYIRIVNGGLKNYRVNFIDKATGDIIYGTVLQNNGWAKASRMYYTDWKIQIDDGQVTENIEMDFRNKRVFIVLDSKALGDTIAWMPYAREFKKKHNCHVILSTYHNDLFKENYTDIEFAEPGKSVPNIYAQYTIGWYYNQDQEDSLNFNRHPVHVRTQPMQKTASDILGLEYQEVKPDIWTNKFLEKNKEKLVTIAIHATAQAKYWNNIDGWQKVVDHLRAKGYKVKLLSTEGSTHMGTNPHPTGIEQHPKGPLKKVIAELQKSTIFIGVGSGLSWLAWAVGVPTVLISGFSEEYTEPQSGTVRIGAPEGKCRGCFNSHRLDAGDWKWCPMLKGTDRHFECTTSITGEMVIDKIKHLV